MFHNNENIIDIVSGRFFYLYSGGEGGGGGDGASSLICGFSSACTTRRWWSGGWPLALIIRLWLVTELKNEYGEVLSGWWNGSACGWVCWYRWSGGNGGDLWEKEVVFSRAMKENGTFVNLTLPLLSRKNDCLNQISAKRGPDSTFAVKANTKTLCPKSSWFWSVKIMNRGRVIWPRVEYRVEYQILGEFLSKKVEFLLKSG